MELLNDLKGTTILTKEGESDLLLAILAEKASTAHFEALSARSSLPPPAAPAAGARRHVSTVEHPVPRSLALWKPVVIALVVVGLFVVLWWITNLFM